MLSIVLMLAVNDAYARLYQLLVINNNNDIVVIAAVRVSAKSVCYSAGTSQAVVSI